MKPPGSGPPPAVRAGVHVLVAAAFGTFAVTLASIGIALLWAALSAPRVEAMSVLACLAVVIVATGAGWIAVRAVTALRSRSRDGQTSHRRPVLGTLLVGADALGVQPSRKQAAMNSQLADALDDAGFFAGLDAPTAARLKAEARTDGYAAVFRHPWRFAFADEEEIAEGNVEQVVRSWEPVFRGLGVPPFEARADESDTGDYLLRSGARSVVLLTSAEEAEDVEGCKLGNSWGLTGTRLLVEANRYLASTGRPERFYSYLRGNDHSVLALTPAMFRVLSEDPSVPAAWRPYVRTERWPDFGAPRAEPRPQVTANAGELDSPSGGVAASSLLQDIAAGAEWVGTALQSSGYLGDFTAASLADVERFFAEHSAGGKPVAGGLLDADTGARLFALGAYVGETLRRTIGGTWEVCDEDPLGEINVRLRLPDGREIFPVQRVMARVQLGPEESVVAYAVAAGLDVRRR